MIRALCFFFFLLLNISFYSQDSSYARKVITNLCSKKYFGRGYVHHGVNRAANYIIKELKRSGAKPLCEGSYSQKLKFNVNTYPGKVKVKLNGKELKAGKDFIIDPASIGVKGEFAMKKKDSVTYISESSPHPLIVTLNKKLTYSVATHTLPYCQMEILKEIVSGPVNEINIDIKSKYVKNYETENICAYADGRITNDTVIVLTAHYDHLGGLGRHVYFPGANDNASGVSMVLDLVRYYKIHPPKYKTVFIFFTGEEAGLIGSKYFVESHLIDLKQIKFLINFDLLGTGDDGIMVVNGAIHKSEFERLKSINERKQLVKEIKMRGKAKNSDHYWFSEAGVPSFFIYTLGGAAAYHDVNDVAVKLPLTDYCDVFRLLTDYIAGF